jgi:hypothetical protein
MRFADDRGVITFEVTTLGRTGRIGTKTVTDRCPLNHPTRVPASPAGELGARCRRSPLQNAQALAPASVA